MPCGDEPFTVRVPGDVRVIIAHFRSRIPVKIVDLVITRNTEHNIATAGDGFETRRQLRSPGKGISEGPNQRPISLCVRLRLVFDNLFLRVYDPKGSPRIEPAVVVAESVAWHY